jgi:Rrf2 family transcriptional regulator, cysteine metabolism repressor
MRVSSKADYGVRALFDLALHYGQGPIQSRDIAARQRISEAYLHQVLSALGRAGLVRSTRGPLGGHELVREPAEISVWDVIVTLDGYDRRAHPHSVAGEENADPVHDVWHELQHLSIEFLKSITLESLVERKNSAVPALNYSI